MGSAGFLVGAQTYLRAHYGDELSSDTKFAQHFHTAMFHGYDMDRTMLRIGAMNMLLHGVENPDIAYKDSLSEKNEDAGRYTLVLAIPCSDLRARLLSLPCISSQICTRTAC